MIPVSDLLEWLPHRPPMLWVDEVLSFGSEGGECLVRLKKDAHYYSQGALRPTAMIEFMAQAHGFVTVCNFKNSSPTAEPLKEALLVAVSEASFEDFNQYPEIVENPVLYVKTGAPRKIGLITMYSGSVSTSKKRIIATANIKVFSH